jgi:hypothetical protein
VENLNTLRSHSVYLAIALLVSFIFRPVDAVANSKWTPLSSSDYIFGYSSKKYSCWSGTFDQSNTPTLQVYANERWVNVSKGIVLTSMESIEKPCEKDFPIAIGYQWTFMTPSPPSDATRSNRYRVLYRQKLPDVKIQKTVLVEKEVKEERVESRTVLTVVQEPYIKKVLVRGSKGKKPRNQRVIAYRDVSVEKIETFTVSSTVMKQFPEIRDEVIPGTATENAEFAVYPSYGAMQEYVTDVASSILCSFGFTERCKNR